jgi:chromosome segregation ATPase
MRCPIECTNPPGFQPAPVFRGEKSERLAGIPTLAPLAKIPFYPSVSERFGFANRPDAKRIADKRKRDLQVIEDRIQVTEREIHTANQEERDKLRRQRESLQKEYDDMQLGKHDVYENLADTQTILERVVGERDDARADLQELAGVENELGRVNDALQKTRAALEEEKSGAGDWEAKFQAASDELFASGQKLDQAQQASELNESALERLDSLQSEVNIIREAMEHPASGEFKGAHFADHIKTQQQEITNLQEAAAAAAAAAKKNLETVTAERGFEDGHPDGIEDGQTCRNRIHSRTGQ